MSDHPKSSLTRELVALLRRPVPPDERTRARRHLLDWVGIVVGALRSQEGRILTGHVRRAPAGPATAVGVGMRTTADAAFVNAGLGLVLELDDVHRRAKLHPGPVVIPAAVAAGEQIGVRVNELLDAIVRGYEAMIRVGESVGDAHYRHWHTTSTCGTFGAAAAAGSLYALDDDALVHALGNAGTSSAGLWQCRPERAMSKPLHAGRAAVSGLQAAQLAADGLTGPEHILEGELGFYAATCPDSDADAVTATPLTWRIGGCSLKPWPGCRHVHPAMDAARRFELSDQALRAVKRVDVRTYRVALDFADFSAPRTTGEAMFSLQHATAYALRAGDPCSDAFGPEAINDPRVAELRSRTKIHVGEDFDKEYPDHWGAEVTVTFPDGSQTEWVRDALGDPESPMSLGDVVTKVRPLLEHARLDPPAVIERILNTDGTMPVTQLLEPVRTG